jgi:hypothetical protein
LPERLSGGRAEGVRTQHGGILRPSPVGGSSRQPAGLC